MSRCLTLALCVGALCVAGTASAQTSRPTSRPSSRPVSKRTSRRIVSADQSEANATRLLMKIMWHKDLEQAKARAKRENKLIFWMHSVGELSDKL